MANLQAYFLHLFKALNNWKISFLYAQQENAVNESSSYFGAALMRINKYSEKFGYESVFLGQQIFFKKNSNKFQEDVSNFIINQIVDSPELFLDIVRDYLHNLITQSIQNPLITLSSSRDWNKIKTLSPIIEMLESKGCEFVGPFYPTLEENQLFNILTETLRKLSFQDLNSIEQEFIYTSKNPYLIQQNERKQEELQKKEINQKQIQDQIGRNYENYLRQRNEEIADANQIFDLASIDEILTGFINEVDIDENDYLVKIIQKLNLLNEQEMVEQNMKNFSNLNKILKTLPESYDSQFLEIPSKLQKQITFKYSNLNNKKICQALIIHQYLIQLDDLAPQMLFLREQFFQFIDETLESPRTPLNNRPIWHNLLEYSQAVQTLLTHNFFFIRAFQPLEDNIPDEIIENILENYSLFNINHIEKTRQELHGEEFYFEEKR